MYRHSNYDPGEVTRKDKFTNPYIGKLYIAAKWNPMTKRWVENIDPFDTNLSMKAVAQRVEATEVLSVGIESMVEDAAKFAREAPDYFDFIYNLLRGL